MSKKNIYRSAYGLCYEVKEGGAPSLTIKGERLNADDIVKIAKRYGVPVVENPDLVRALRMLKLEEEIPEELFEAVALLLNKLEGN